MVVSSDPFFPSILWTKSRQDDSSGPSEAGKHMGYMVSIDEGTAIAGWFMKKTHWNDFEMDDLWNHHTGACGSKFPFLCQRWFCTGWCEQQSAADWQDGSGWVCDWQSLWPCHVESCHGTGLSYLSFHAGFWKNGGSSSPWLSTLKWCNFWMIWGYPILGNLHVCMDPSISKPWFRTDSIWHWPAPSAVAASERDVRGEVQRAVFFRGGIDGGAQHEWRITG